MTLKEISQELRGRADAVKAQYDEVDRWLSQNLIAQDSRTETMQRMAHLKTIFEWLHEASVLSDVAGGRLSQVVETYGRDGNLL